MRSFLFCTLICLFVDRISEFVQRWTRKRIRNFFIDIFYGFYWFRQSLITHRRIWVYFVIINHICFR